MIGLRSGQSIPNVSVRRFPDPRRQTDILFVYGSRSPFQGASVMHDLQHCAGLAFGCVFRGGQGRLVHDETLHEALEEGADWVWLHLGLSDHRARRFLGDFPELPEVGRNFLLGGESRIQIALEPDHAAGVLPDLEKDFEDQSMEPGRLAFWLDRKLLFTPRRKPVRAIQKLHDAIVAGLELESP